MSTLGTYRARTLRRKALIFEQLEDRVFLSAASILPAILPTWFQDFTDADGVKMYEKLAAVVGEIANAEERVGSNEYSNIGMVIGGTSPEETTKLREMYPNIWFLVPGFGSQGASAEDCVRFCNSDGLGALVSASRSIIYAYEKPAYKSQFGDDWQKCIAQAVADAKIELAKASGS